MLNYEPMKQNVYDYSFEMRRERKRKITFTLTLSLSVILGLTLFLNIFLFPVHVKSDSMESDIARNSAVFVTPLIKTPHRGDVIYLSREDNLKLSWYSVVVNKVVAFFTAQQYEPIGYTKKMSGKNSVRRVLALPGDTVYMQDYVLYIKPKGESHFLTEFEMCSKPYNIHIYSVPVEWDGLGPSSNMEEITLGKDEYFVLADNRVEAVDSRLYGAISSKRIRGKVLLEYFPFSKMRTF